MSMVFSDDEVRRGVVIAVGMIMVPALAVGWFLARAERSSYTSAADGTSLVRDESEKE